MANSITPTQGNLGIVSNRTTLLSYSVTTDGTMGTITEKVNGVTVGTRNTPVSGQDYTVSLTQAQWDAVRFGKYADTLGSKNTLTITMGDNTWTYTFDKRPANDADILSAVKAVKDSQEVHLPNIKRQLVDKVGGNVADSFEEIIGGAVLGRKMASGTVTSIDLIACEYLATTGTINKYSVTVSGLSFKPSRITVYEDSASSSSSAYTVYTSEKILDQFTEGQVYINLAFQSRSTGSEALGFKAVGNLYVNDTSFRLPVENSNKVYRWEAYE